MDALSILGLRSCLIGPELPGVADLGSSLFKTRGGDLFVDQEPDLDSTGRIIGREGRCLPQYAFAVREVQYSDPFSPLSNLP
jgi:hypothetical protein